MKLARDDTVALGRDKIMQTVGWVQQARENCSVNGPRHSVIDSIE